MGRGKTIKIKNVNKQLPSILSTPSCRQPLLRLPISPPYESTSESEASEEEEQDPFADLEDRNVNNVNNDTDTVMTETADSDNMDWVTDLAGYPDIPDFEAIPGLHLPPGISTPLDIFFLFFNPEMIDQIVLETNRYADHIISNAHRSARDSFKLKWKPVSRTDILGFLLVLIHMSCVKKHKIQDYWTTEASIATPFASKIMSHYRFSYIMRAFHLNDNATYVPPNQPNHDPLHKIRPFYVHLHTKFQDALHP